MHWLIIAALLLAGAGLTLLLMLEKQQGMDARRRFKEVLDAREDAGWLSQAVGDNAGGVGGDLLKRIANSFNQSVELNLRRAGRTSVASRTVYYAIAAIAPVAGLLAGGVWAVASGDPAERVLASAFVGFCAGFLLPSRILGWLAGRRQRLIREELLPVLHLLRMLFDAGLSLEHALRVVHEQGRELTPALAEELGLALARINNGQERGEALEEMAAPLGVHELSDTVAILKQATRYGGSLRDSLARFAALIEERRMLALRETVSKLSAKMTIVMVVFLFPALMIFLAGPGFMALAGALKGM